MKFKDYKCRVCDGVNEYVFNDCEPMPSVIDDMCDSCGKVTNQDKMLFGGIVHIPPGAQAVPTRNIR